jgi:hypothetical protein
MKQATPTYTASMDRLVLTTAGLIAGELSTRGQTSGLLGLLRKLVRSCLELAGDEATGETESGYTWEEKIESLVVVAKAAGRYLNAEPGTDYAADARMRLLEAYDAFCLWRHDEPYVVDEIKTLLEGKEQA